MPQSPQNSPKKTGILIILLLSLLLNAVGIWHGLPSTVGWAADEILPRDIQDGIARRFSHDWFYKYPPLQYYVLTLAEAPLLIYGNLSGRDLNSVSFNSCLILVNRLVSLIMAAGIVLLVYKCGKEIFDHRSSLFAALISALLIPFVYHAKTANLDVPFMFWFTISLLFFLRLLKTRRRKYYLLFALSATLTLTTKDQAYGLYILPPLVVLFTDWKLKKKAIPNLTIVRFLCSRTYLYAAAVAVSTFCLIYNLPFNAQGFLHHIKLITGPISQNYKLVSHNVSGHIYLLGRAWSQVRFSLGWPLFLVCLAGVVRWLASKPRNFLPLSLFAFVIPYEIFFIHVVLFNYSRYYLPLLIILSLFGGQFLASLLETRPKFSALSRAAMAAVFIYSIFYAASLDIYMIKDARYAAEKWMGQNIPKEAAVGLAVWRVYAPRVEGYRWIRLMPTPSKKFRALRVKPDFVIINTAFKQRFRPERPGGQFFQKLDRGKEAYQVVFQHQTPLDWLPLKHREVLEQIHTINPEIVIYKKARKALRKPASAPSDIRGKDKANLSYQKKGEKSPNSGEADLRAGSNRLGTGNKRLLAVPNGCKRVKYVYVTPTPTLPPRGGGKGWG